MRSNYSQTSESIRSCYADSANAAPARESLQANINAEICVIGDNIFFIHGYSGHGVTATHLAGKLISEAIDGHPERFNQFSELPYSPLPGGRLFRIPLSIIGSWWYIARDKLGI